MCFTSPKVAQIGRRFDCTLMSHLRELKLLDSQQPFAPGKAQNKASLSGIYPSQWTPVFVTAASDNHFGECRRLVNNLHQNSPNSTIVLYDLGLSARNVSLNELL